MIGSDPTPSDAVLAAGIPRQASEDDDGRRRERDAEAGDRLEGPSVADHGSSEKQLQWQMTLTVFLVATVVFALSPVVTNYDSFATLPTAVSIVNRHTLSLDAYQHVKVLAQSYTVGHTKGQLLTSYPWAVGLFAVPAVVVIDLAHVFGGPSADSIVTRSIAHRSAGPAVDRLGRHRIGLRRPGPSRLPAVRWSGPDAPSLGRALWLRLRVRHERLVHRLEGALGTRAVHPVHRGRPSRPRPALSAEPGGSCARDGFGLATSPPGGTDPRRGGDRASDQRRRPGVGNGPGALEDLHPTAGRIRRRGPRGLGPLDAGHAADLRGTRCSPTPWRTSSAPPRPFSNPWRPS